MPDYLHFPPGPFGPYSSAVRSRGFLFISGQIPVDETGEVIEGGVYEQTRKALKQLYRAAGWPEKEVNPISFRVYTTVLEEAVELNRAYADFHSENELPLPARELIGVSALPKGALVEIAGIFSE